MDNAQKTDITHHSRDPVFYIVAEQSSENFRIVNLIKYSVIIVISVVAALIIYAVISWLAANVSLQFFFVRMLMMSFIPIFAMSFMFFVVAKGMRSIFGRTKSNIKIIIYSFYNEYFVINAGHKIRSFKYEKIRRTYRFLDHIVLLIKGVSPQFLPPQVFASDHQMVQFESFINEKIEK